MRFIETPLAGSYVIETDRIEDHRGFFARTFCAKELAAMNLETNIAQTNLSYNHKRGTLRGMHFQHEPHAEVKIVRCIAGTIYDVIIDIRPGSSSFRQWFGVELSAENRRSLYIPKGFAHGYQTLCDGCEVFYMVTSFYTPGAEGGIRWDDPAFGIQWKIASPILSEKDRAYPDFAVNN